MAATKLTPLQLIKILLLEDNPDDADLCIRKLKGAGLAFEVDLARNSREFIELIRSRIYDVVLTDYRLPDFNGLDALNSLRSFGRDTPVILVTGTLGDEVAIDCIRSGISDYVLKENLGRLPVAVRRVIKEYRLRQDYDRAEAELRESEKQYRLLFHANPHPMWVFDRETLRFLTVNEAALRHYGYSLKEFLSMTAEDIRPTEEVNRFLAAVRARNKFLVSGTWKHKKKDGTIIDVEITSQSITFRAVDAILALAHDVTEQRRAQAEVQEGKEQLQLLLDSTAEGILAVDMNGICTLCNSACLRVLGYSHESELIGKDLHALAHHSRPDGKPYPLRECKIIRAFRQGACSHVTDEVLWRRDGSSFPVEYWCHPVLRDGRIVGAVITFFDISERHHSADQLRLERERLALALKVGKSCTFDWNIRENTNLWSPESEALYGLAHGQSGTRHEDWEACIVPDDLDRARADIEESLKTGELASEWRIQRRSDGEVRWMHVRAKVFFDHAGRPAHMIGINVDTTDRKTAEEQLRLSESRYRSIIESAPYGIYRVDGDGNLVEVNRAFVEMLGYQAAEELIGRNMASEIYLDPAERQRIISSCSSEVPSTGHEAKWIRKDRTTIIVRIAGRRLPGDDLIRGGHEVFVEDVTEKRSLQKRFQHAQKMEAVGRLAGGVAHDFNNLLMVISGYAQLMGESRMDAIKISEYAARIEDASSKAAAITRQLLAFSRKEVVEPAVLNLNGIVTDLDKMLPRLLGEDVEVSLHLEAQLGTVRADRGQIEQVIMNLAVNARDAMPQGGRLAIETSNVELDTAYHQRREIAVPPGRYVLLSVSDTGIGMNADTQLHIFEPFFTTKEEGKGTGLGLAIVYGIVKQHQGFIWVYSEVNKGSTFKIYLPRLDQIADAEHIAKSLEAAPAGTETILLVEDEVSVRNVTRVYLESKGYTVLEAANGKEALNICKIYSKPIHLLITDMVMPGMGGLELAGSALKLLPGLSIVLVSGYSDRTSEKDAGGVQAKFLQKPFSLDNLARTVRSSLSKKRQILLIEDSKLMRAAVSRTLTRAGYFVSTAPDGEEGFRLAQESVPDLILLDATLPKPSAPEVLRTLKKYVETRDVPVVVMAARSAEKRKQYLREGAAACLAKSAKVFEKDSALLMEAIVQVLGKPATSESEPTLGSERAENP